MKTADEIAKRLREVCSDEKLQQPSVTIEVNAPLALMQLALETERSVLQWVLNIRYDRSETKKEKK
jgi:hypothetical protein